MNSLKNCSGSHHASIGAGNSLSKKISLSLILFLICGSFFQSCGPSREEMAYREKAAEVANSIAEYMPSVKADTIDGVARHFVRTATFNCRISDVLAATKTIEDVVSAHGGYSTSSHLTSVVNYSNTVHFAKDSILEQIYYTTENTMSLRVPSRFLDTVLRKINVIAEFIDDSKLTSDDVTRQLYSNSLAEKRLKNFKQRVEKKSIGKESALNHAVTAEESILEKQAMADEKNSESYNLADRVKYSTLTIRIYEAQKSINLKSLLPVNAPPYEASFVEKFGVAFSDGFRVLKNVILFLAENWGVFLIIGIISISARAAVRLYHKHYVINSK